MISATSSSSSSSLSSSSSFTQAIYTIVPKVLKLVKQSALFPNIEAECMILKSIQNGQVTNNLAQGETSEEARKLLHKMLEDTIKTHSDRIGTISDTKKWYSTEDKFFSQGKIRATHERNSETDELQLTWTQKDFIQRQIYRIPQLDKKYLEATGGGIGGIGGNNRVAGASRRDDDDDPMLQSLAYNALSFTVKREKKLSSDLVSKKIKELKLKEEYIRKKQRVSIWWKGKPFRTDFTLVYVGGKTLIQIETEIVSDEKNLINCKMSMDDYQKNYLLDDPFLLYSEVKQREKRFTAEWIEHSLLPLCLHTKTRTLTLSRYSQSFYVG